MNGNLVPNQMFDFGHLVATPGAVDALAKSGDSALKFLNRHGIGDWGDVCKEDQKENDFSLKAGFRLLSVYYTTNGTKIWIITEADRSVTTLLLPEDY